MFQFGGRAIEGGGGGRVLEYLGGFFVRGGGGGGGGGWGRFVGREGMEGYGLRW